VQDLGLAAFKALGCRVFSRVDMIYTDNNQIAVLEVNTVPGLTATSLVPKAARAAGISFEELCSKIIEYSLKK
ncbi:MAG: D-alanine--D-alanine ligase, partial [Candidatus Omnitrophica bacterium]|nr:D-alanine--D-alanine ligase [Candidatus Omnitrophota bacterium]